MIHALTIDVEDYYSIYRRDLFGVEGPPTDAVVRNTSRVLERLAKHGVKATFFMLGEVAATFPDLARKIVAEGHEIGVHGYLHRQVFKLSRDEFRREVGDAKKRIEDAAGVRVEGHRAPAFSIRPDTAWGLEVLAGLGLVYDSSIFPIAGRRYGWPGFAPDIQVMKLPCGVNFIEAPLSTVTILGKALPVCGGGYFRHFPYAVTRWAIWRIARVRPAIVYIHPHELDTTPGPPDFVAALKKAPRPVRRFHRLQMRRRKSFEKKLERLLSDFQFAPLRSVIATALRRNA